MVSVKAWKSLLFAAGLAPVGYLAWAAATGNLGANPIEQITRETGVWTLRFLLVTLAVSPVRRVTHWNDAIRFRRMLGLFAFFYGVLHLVTYLWLDQFFDWAAIVKDVYKRPFITAGATAFLVMVPLAVTSTAGMIRRLGGKTWRRVHRLVYLSATAGVVHYWWLVKADIRQPRNYAVLLAVLLGYRAYEIAGSKRARGSEARST
ncbi:MAG: sulfoxide reductase heme-binding subunit YedZ [Acidobacteria bacterium]|nr:sulfoxide reductase heme-binding subunit YedZ [Acidobacteriota bacterium]